MKAIVQKKPVRRLILIKLRHAPWRRLCCLYNDLLQAWHQTCPGSLSL